MKKLSTAILIIFCLTYVQSMSEFQYSATYLKHLQRLNFKCVDIIQYFIKRYPYFISIKHFKFVLIKLEYFSNLKSKHIQFKAKRFHNFKPESS